ncbi:hypothetical protein ElyMa_003262600 [Elysia marginata]|uniref:WAP domain-containing protein n=1 Tax=Elysia marginata TaxID=1093978 RepID=A0AAV4J996_9GAST|nr:hypothetical protein ElyMa_003262600 [Elysia marginata]
MIKEVALLISVGFCLVAASNWREDPSCVGKICQAGKVCRKVKACYFGQRCKLETKCVVSPESVSAGEYQCSVGHVVLYEAWTFEMKPLTCGPYQICPSGSYCSTKGTGLDGYCCASDPGASKKPGKCPASVTRGDKSVPCYKMCNNDGDCSQGGEICCHSECHSRCVLPLPGEPKSCPFGQYLKQSELCLGTLVNDCNLLGECRKFFVRMLRCLSYD